MANVTIEIPEAQVAVVKRYGAIYAGLPEATGAKQLAAAILNKVVVETRKKVQAEEAATAASNAVVPPEVT